MDDHNSKFILNVFGTKDLYAILEVSKSSSYQEIKSGEIHGLSIIFFHQ